MNEVLQKQLDRVENALTTLVESITSYNPSLIAVQELLSADDAFAEGLDRLQQHQANHAHLTFLAAQTTDLDTHLTTTLTALAQTRASILAHPASSSTQTQRPVPHTTLLAYAKNISRYGAPRDVKTRTAAAARLATAQALPPPLTQSSTQQDGTQGERTQEQSFLATQISSESSTQPSNGITSTASSFPTPFHPRAPTSPANPVAGSQGFGIATLTDPEKQWLDPLAQMPYLPWPSEDVIRRGALATLGTRLDTDELLGGYIKEQPEQTQEAEMMAGVEAALTNGEDRKVEDGKMEDEAAGRRVTKAEDVAEAARKPSVFAGLDLYDPEDE